MTTIDARGLSCPQPVILVAKAIDAGETIFEVLVDNECSYENVTRLLENKKFKFETDEKNDYKVIRVGKYRK